MRLRWKKALLCLCALMGLVHSGVVSTQDTIVVSRSDDPIQEQSTTTVSGETTTEEPSLPVKLTEMEVKSEVSSRYAHTAIVTRVRNPAKRSQEATFRVLLPETAFISGFTMILDGKPYKAYVKEKEEAKQIYNQAVSQGIGAAHVAAKARDSNHFTVSVNVEPNTTAVFNLTYEELLTRRNGVYNHAINLHPGALVPRLTVTVHIKEPNKIKVLRVPEIRTGNEIDATDKDAQNSKAVIQKSNEDHDAIITFTPTLEEQQTLAQIYAEKTKDSMHNRRRWYSSQNEEEKSDGTLGQFVIQYDVERPDNGEVLVNDGYFVHFFAPSSLPPLNKHVVFVLDTSGSMLGRKIVQLREAMQTILTELKPRDYFNIVEFASSVHVHDLKEADDENSTKISPWSYSESTTLVPPAQATAENIAKAKVIVGRLDGGGATAISTALNVAIDLVQKGIGWKHPETNVTPASEAPEADDKDAEANKTPKVEEKEIVADKPKETTVANKDEIELEPIIIFLTDGEPTTGETNLKRIINLVTERNYGKKKASIFSLAFGEGADRDFLRKLSLRNDGFMRHIYEASDAALQLHDFYRQVSSPLLSDVKFTYPEDQVKEDTLTKYKYRTFYDGSEVVIAGRLLDSTIELTPRVSGFCGVEDGLGRRRYEIFPKVPTPAKKDKYFPLERLWAYLTIKQLLDERDAAEANDKSVNKENGPEKKALDLALKYEFVTPLTSLVVVKPNATNAVNAESVDKESGGGPQFAYDSGVQVSALHGSSVPQTVPMSLLPMHQWFASSPDVQPQAISFSDLAEESEDLDSSSYMKTGVTLHDRLSFGGAAPAYALPGVPGPYRPFIVTTTIPPLPSTTENPLDVYHLQQYAWVNYILNTTSDTLRLDINGTTIILKLTKDEVAPKNTDGDAECSNELSGTPGVTGLCVYLTRCEAAKSIPLQVYRFAHCSVNGYAGVCCPKNKVDQIATTSQLP